MSLTMGYHYGPSADLLVLVRVRHELRGPNSHPFEDYPLAGSAAILYENRFNLKTIFKAILDTLERISDYSL